MFYYRLLLYANPKPIVTTYCLWRISMKFTNMKNNAAFLAVMTLFLVNGTLIKPAHATEDKRLECGRKVGATLALCLFKSDDNRTFLDYIAQWRKIIDEYRPYFDAATVTTATKALDDIETYIKIQYSQGKYVNPNKVAAFLSQLTKSLPENVSKQLDVAFEQLQLKLLNRNKPLGMFQLLGPLSNRLNNKPAA